MRAKERITSQSVMAWHWASAICVCAMQVAARTEAADMGFYHVQALALCVSCCGEGTAEQARERARLAAALRLDCWVAIARRVD